MFKKLTPFKKKKDRDDAPRASERTSGDVWRNQSVTQIAPELQPTASVLPLQQPLPDSSIDKALRWKIIEALKTLNFTGSEVLQLRGNEAQRALDAMQQLFDSPAFWQSAERKHPAVDRWLLPPLMVKLARESGQLSNSIYATLDFVEPDHIAAGGFGEVFIGMLQGRRVAVKRLRIYQTTSEEERGRLTWDLSREALVLRNLHHPSVLEFLGIDLSFPVRPGLVTPWMKHGSIMGYMGKLDPPIHQRNKWLYEISQGMQYLHESSIVHGDLKATNILVADNGQLKISDFGLAVFEGNWSRNFGSQHGGNVRWMAPEILSFHTGQHQRPTYASDVYSFAMVCIEIYTRKIPFQDIKWNQGETLEMLIIGGKRPSIPASMSEELSSHLVIWWHGSLEQRPPMQYVMEFFHHPTKLAKKSMLPMGSTISPNQLQKTTFSRDLVELLCKGISSHQLSPHIIKYPNCPLHIIIDEKALLAGLYKLSNDTMDQAAQFSYPIFQFILERNRTVTSRTLFTALEKSTSPSAFALQSLGYGLMTSSHKNAMRTDICVAKIQNDIIDISPYGILVLFTGGREGWMDDWKFAQCILAASQRGWQVEILAWNNTTTEKKAWYNAIPGSNSSNSSCITFLEMFYGNIFSL